MIGTRAAYVLVMLLAALATAVFSSASAPSQASAAPANKAKLELRKAEAEIARSEAEAKKSRDEDGWLWRALPFLAPVLTAATAVGGVFVSVRKAGKDRAKADAAAETTRFDERFAKAVSGLSSASPGEQSGAAVLIASMVRDKRESLSDQALQLLLVSLQAPHDEACERLLRSALERFARAAPHRLVATEEGQVVNGLAHLRTPYLKLANLDLPGLDIAFATLRKAEFHDANLRGCRAYEAVLEEADFRRANLTSAQWVKARVPGGRFQNATLLRARLHQAQLAEAKFFRADLTRANLRQADLTGARFEEARLAKADFHGATLDTKALASILEAKDWSAAEFDQATEERLRELRG